MQKFPYQKPLTILMAIATQWSLMGCLFDKESQDNSTLLTLITVGHEQERNAAIQALEASKQCEFTYNTTMGGQQEICKPGLGITDQAHYRIEDLAIETNNSYFYLNVGFNEIPANLPTNTAGSGRYTFFNGPSASTIPSGNPISQSRFQGLFCGEANNCITAVPGFGTAIAYWQLSTVTTGSPALPNQFGPSTICFDFRDNGESTPPRITIWATGKNGADCKNFSTLTKANALFNKEDWPVGSRISLLEKSYIRYSNPSTIRSQKIVVRSETVLRD